MRSCEVTIDGATLKATFHMWAEYANVISGPLTKGDCQGGQVMYPVAVVEYEDGQCNTVPAYTVQFTDKEKKLKVKVIEDEEEFKRIVKMIESNDGYCPCKIAKNVDTKCMCREFREQTKPGKCHCGLYIKVEE